MKNPVQRARVDNGLTHARLAQLTGLSHSFVRAVCTGQRAVTVAVALKFAAVFGGNWQRFITRGKPIPGVYPAPVPTSAGHPPVDSLASGPGDPQASVKTTPARSTKSRR